MLKRILITGASGQIGTDLTHRLLKDPTVEILATDLNEKRIAPNERIHYYTLDVVNQAALEDIVNSYKPHEVYHLAALLSGTAERKPDLAWKLNVDATRYLFDSCLKLEGVKIFLPSSIAVFGPGSGKQKVSQTAYLDPHSTYGITKIACERLMEYYYHKHGLDVRSLRFPGLISYSAHAGGGTTDYAVDMFHHAVEGKKYTSFVSADTTLPMLYMADAIDAIMQLMEADPEQIKCRGSYNIQGFALSPRQVYEELKKEFIDFEIEYQPDFRQEIADSWPQSLDDAQARADWNYKPTYTFERMAREMVDQLSQTLAQQ